MRPAQKRIKYLGLFLFLFAVILLLNGCAAHLQGEKSTVEQVWYGIVDVLIFALVVAGIYNTLLAIFKLKILKALLNILITVVGLAFSLFLVEVGFNIYVIQDFNRLLAIFDNIPSLLQVSKIINFYEYFYHTVFSLNFLAYDIVIHIGVLLVIGFTFYLVIDRSRYSDYKGQSSSEDEDISVSADERELVASSSEVITDDHFNDESNFTSTEYIIKPEERKPADRERRIDKSEHSTSEQSTEVEDVDSFGSRNQFKQDNKDDNLNKDDEQIESKVSRRRDRDYHRRNTGMYIDNGRDISNKKETFINKDRSFWSLENNRTDKKEKVQDNESEISRNKKEVEEKNERETKDVIKKKMAEDINIKRDIADDDRFDFNNNLNMEIDQDTDRETNQDKNQDKNNITDDYSADTYHFGKDLEDDIIDDDIIDDDIIDDDIIEDDIIDDDIVDDDIVDDDIVDDDIFIESESEEDKDITSNLSNNILEGIYENNNEIEYEKDIVEDDTDNENDKDKIEIGDDWKKDLINNLNEDILKNLSGSDYLEDEEDIKMDEEENIEINSDYNIEDFKIIGDKENDNLSNIDFSNDKENSDIDNIGMEDYEELEDDLGAEFRDDEDFEDFEDNNDSKDNLAISDIDVNGYENSSEIIDEIEDKELRDDQDVKSESDDENITMGYENEDLNQEKDDEEDDENAIDLEAYKADEEDDRSIIGLEKDKIDEEEERNDIGLEIYKVAEDVDEEDDDVEEDVVEADVDEEDDRQPVDFQVIDDAVLDFESPKFTHLNLNDDEMHNIREDFKNMIGRSLLGENLEGEVLKASEPQKGEASLIKAISSKDSFEKLIKLGADVNEQDEQGRNCLHYLCEEIGTVSGDHLYLIRLLVENGVDINCQDNDGNTPLHMMSTSNGNASAAIKYLKINGARLDIKNNDGYTPYELAAREDDLALINLLKD